MIDDIDPHWFCCVGCFVAFWLEKTAKYRAMDAVLSDVQKDALSVGAVGRPSRQFQSGPGAGNDFEKIMPQRADVFPGADERRAQTLCARVQRLHNDRRRRTYPFLKFSLSDSIIRVYMYLQLWQCDGKSLALVGFRF